MNAVRGSIVDAPVGSWRSSFVCVHPVTRKEEEVGNPTIPSSRLAHPYPCLLANDVGTLGYCSSNSIIAPMHQPTLASVRQAQLEPGNRWLDGSVVKYISHHTLPWGGVLPATSSLFSFTNLPPYSYISTLSRNGALSTGRHLSNPSKALL